MFRTYRVGTTVEHQHADCVYRHYTEWLRKNCNNNDFTPLYFTLDNFNILKILLIQIVLPTATIDILM